MLANNLANTGTAGFKADREFYSTYLAPELANDSADPLVGEAPVVQKQWTDFGQGTLLPTGNPTDLALSGSGFFSVQGPNGPLYTRDGKFHVSQQGVLMTDEGYPALMTTGKPVQLQPGIPMDVSSDGQILQAGNVIGQLQVSDFADATQLDKQGSSYFVAPQNLKPTASSAQVLQGKTETSNVPPAEAATRLVSVMRQFEMLQRAIKMGTEMNREAIEQVARVGS